MKHPERVMLAADLAIAAIAYSFGILYAVGGNYGQAVVYIIAGMLWIAVTWLVLD